MDNAAQNHQSPNPHQYLTPEHCYIAENHSDPAVSIARATIKPGVTTKAHHLIQGVQEIYIITSGKGTVYIGDCEPTEVTVGDVVVIPPETSQKVTNTGDTDLVFYCVCTPQIHPRMLCRFRARPTLTYIELRNRDI
jgi:mannose-6-phosphate isomerase-like protein (cupin superfamily)